MNLFDAVGGSPSRTTAGEGARQAALALHSMEDADREWLLEQLPEDQRLHLWGLLEELVELGIARRGMEPTRRSVAAVEAVDPRRAKIASCDVGQIVQLLRHEPSGLVDRVIALGPWPWQEAVLRAQIAQTARPSVKRGAEASQRVPPALEDALLTSLAGRIGDIDAQRAPSSNEPTARLRLAGWCRGLLARAR